MWRANNPEHEGYKNSDKSMIFGSKKERELGVHCARPDEVYGYCMKCGKLTIFLKVVKNEPLCRMCRNVCTDCGREDCPPEELQYYAANKAEHLCPDCFVCRMY